MPGEFQSLADAIYRDRIRRARATPPVEKLFDGPQLFEGVCVRMKAGLKLRQPQLTDAQVEEELTRQLRRLERLHAVPLPTD